MSYILFGNKNTHTDYGLIVAPYEIPMPTAQTNFVPVPGRDGSLDLTEAFDAIRFNDRIILLTLSINQLGDALRDRLDVKQDAVKEL